MSSHNNHEPVQAIDQSMYVKRPLNYIGSKLTLLAYIDQILTQHMNRSEGIVVDLFSGSSVVAQYFKQRGYSVIANDWQYYAYVLASAYIRIDTPPLFNQLDCDGFQSIINSLNHLPGSDGLFVQTYCQGGLNDRCYFSQDNGRKIQAIRDQIEWWHESHKLSSIEYLWLKACLLEAVDKVANTTAIYGAFLKQLKQTALKPIVLKPIQPADTIHSNQMHDVFCMDSIAVLETISSRNVLLTYIDPPYNHRQYSSNYHILETIARWDLHAFKPRGITGLRTENENKSRFGMRDLVVTETQRLLDRVESQYVLFSYNNEGLLSERTLIDLISNQFTILEFKKIPYCRFQTDSKKRRRIRRKVPEEYLILAQSKK